MKEDGAMKVSEAIAALERIQKTYGDVPVFFDCPDCHVSFTPSVCVPVAAHFSDKKTIAGKRMP